MDVVESYDVSGTQRIPKGIGADPWTLQHSAHAYMTRNDGVGNAGQLAVKKMDVGATNFTGNRLQKDRPGLQNRIVQLPKLNRSMGSNHDCRSYAHGEKVQTNPWRCYGLRGR